ncbi:MAG: DUF559 domain-containing protein [Armatimonadetes bacterium]|nr:DUF559 domain-containing protein [Armatimonadota bacterium]
MKAAAREARKQQTPAERALWEVLRDHRCGVHFRRQAVRRPFRLDFYCARLRLAIEVDGSIHDEPDVQRRDADRQAILEHDKAIRFLRLTNDDVLKRPTETRQRILAALQTPQTDTL